MFQYYPIFLTKNCQKWILLNMSWYYTICAKKCQYYICWFDFMQLWMDKTDVLVLSDVDIECAPALIIIASNAAHFVWCTVLTGSEWGGPGKVGKKTEDSSLDMACNILRWCFASGRPVVNQTLQCCLILWDFSHPLCRPYCRYFFINI